MLVFAVALVLLFAGWYHLMQGVDATGKGWWAAWAEARRANVTFATLGIIPLVGMVAWGAAIYAGRDKAG